MEEIKTSAKRQTAYKVSVKDLLTGSITEGTEWQPTQLSTRGRTISRVNVIALLVSNEGQTMIIDDGTGTIRVRHFSEQTTREDLTPGDVVQVIGKIREYNDERYISPEILTQTNEKMMTLRKLELEKEMLETKQDDTSIPEEQIIEEEPMTDAMQIRTLIKQLDQGNGADIDEIERKSEFQNTQELINSLLKHGEIFEVRPGRLKVLE